MFGTSFERPSTWAVIAIAALVLFGYKRLPDVTRSVGKSLRIFKTEMKGMSSDDETRDATAAAPSPAPAPAEPTPPAVQAAPPAAPVVADPATDAEATPQQPTAPQQPTS
jgi:sec-independent protein translocase protein TatA